MFLTLTSKKDKIIMTLFLKAGGKHHNGQLWNWSCHLRPFAKGVELDLFDGKTYILLVLCL
jgi:hypothetical protein